MAEELAHHGYRISPGSLYPTLHKMEAEGLLRSTRQVVAGRARRTYVATAKAGEHRGTFTTREAAAYLKMTKEAVNKEIATQAKTQVAEGNKAYLAKRYDDANAALDKAEAILKQGLAAAGKGVATPPPAPPAADGAWKKEAARVGRYQRRRPRPSLADGACRGRSPQVPRAERGGWTRVKHDSRACKHRDRGKYENSEPRDQSGARARE